MCRYFKNIDNGNHISAWKSKGFSDESIKPPATSNNSFAPSLNYIGAKTKVKFEGCCLKQDKITFTHGKMVNIYTVYEINFWDCGYNDYPTLENPLLVAVKLVKNVDIDKYKYSGYAIGFDRHETFSVANGFGKNVVFFGANMSSSVHVDNNKKDILILGEGLAQGLDDKTLTSEKRYLISCTESVVSLNQLY